VKTYLFSHWTQLRLTAVGALAAFAVLSIPVLSSAQNTGFPQQQPTGQQQFAQPNGQQPAGQQPAAAAAARPQAAGAAAPGGSANVTKYNIAVVDISHLFNYYYKVKNARDSMKAESEQIEVSLKAERDKITAMEQQRNMLQPGSADFKQRDEEIARQMAELNLKLNKIRKDFMERESKLYFQSYLEIVDAVKWYAGQRNIGLVLRFNRDAANPDRREEVQREINKLVVVQDQLDITLDVLALLNRDQPAAAPVTGPANGARPAQPSTAVRPAAPGTQIPRQ
jgi:Skp family chaperone for outer membrane proteins